MIVSPYLSILLIAFGLGLIYLFRSRPSAQAKKANRAIYADMTIAADVARASARQVFGVELDLTDKSIALLDNMIARGWTEPIQNVLAIIDAPAQIAALAQIDDHAQVDDPSQEEGEEKGIDINDSYYALAGYLGTVLAYNHNGAWKNDDEHALPYVYFRKIDYAVSPFDVIRKKLLAPQHFDLVSHYNNILWELKQQTEGRAEPTPSDGEETSNA